MTDQSNTQAQSAQKREHATIHEQDELWDKLLATPESDAFLDMLEEEALREYREGKTEEGGFGKEQEA